MYIFVYVKDINYVNLFKFDLKTNYSISMQKRYVLVCDTCILFILKFIKEMGMNFILYKFALNICI